MQPTSTSLWIRPEGWYYVVVLGFILGGAIMNGANLLFLLAGLMVGPLLYSWRMALATLRQVELERRAPRYVQAGEEVVVRLEALNESASLDVWGVSAEDEVACLEGPGVDPVVARVDPPAAAHWTHLETGSRDTAEYRRIWKLRGRYRLGPIQLTTRFPFGLIEASLVLPEEQELVVCPRPGRLTPYWRRWRHRVEQRSEHARRQRRDSQGDFYGLRPWRPGDPRRWVHWPTTARRQRLTVRQFESPRRASWAIVLDLGPTDESPGLSPPVERAVRFVATVLRELCHAGEPRIALVIRGQSADQLVAGVGSGSLLAEANERLAVAMPNAEATLAEALDLAARALPDAAVTWLITTRDEATIQRLLSGSPDRRPPEVLPIASPRCAEFFLEDSPAEVRVAGSREAA